MLTAYYNENDPYAAQWLRNLIAAGEIPDGDVDDRSIVDVRTEDLDGYGQCHFFAGIGGWPLALVLAGWPEDRPVWTGSVPCQPLSSAGQRKGHADERHLWPAFQSLIAECRPPTIFGEQIASKDGREWLSGVRADLEDLGYAIGAADLCAASVGAPHIRQRLWWVANAARATREWNARSIFRTQTPCGGERQQHGDLSKRLKHGGAGVVGGVADAENTDRRPGERPTQEGSGPDRERGRRFGERGTDGGVGNTERSAFIEQSSKSSRQQGPIRRSSSSGGVDDATDGRREGNAAGDWNTKPVDAAPPGGNDFWAAHDLIPCADGKARRVEPSLFPLAHGVPARVGKLRAAGNAIVPQVAAEFIEAFLAAEAEMRRAA